MPLEKIPAYVEKKENRPVETLDVDDADQNERDESAGHRTEDEPCDPHSEALEERHERDFPAGQPQGAIDPELLYPFHEKGK